MKRFLFVNVFVSLLIMTVQSSFVSLAMGGESDGTDFDLDGPQMSGDSENASNPLAMGSNTDLRWQYLDLVDGGGV